MAAHQYIFIGGTYRGHELLHLLIKKNYNPVYCFILEEDKHEAIQYSSKIAELCKENKINFSVTKKLNNEDYKLINNFKTLDFGIVCGWRTLIDVKAINNLKLGLIGAHDSLLPRNRGFAPLNWAIINGESKTGVTLFLISSTGVDNGDIISQKKVPILFTDYAIDVNKKITDATIDLYLNVFQTYKKNKPLQLKKQNEKIATYNCKRTPEDGKINWENKSTYIYNLVRALAYPYPGAFCNFNNEVFFIRKAALGELNKKKFSGRIPGRIISIKKESIEVLCGEGSLLISEWENKQTGFIGNPAEVIKSISTTLK